MDAVMYLKEKGRMLKMNEDVVCNIECEQCPLSRERNGEYLYCTQLEFLKTEKAVEIVEQWSKEHPQNTYATDFFGKFPGARENAQGVPMPCVAYMYGESERSGSCDYGNNPCTCADCWNRPMPEVEK